MNGLTMATSKHDPAAHGGARTNTENHHRYDWTHSYDDLSGNARVRTTRLINGSSARVSVPYALPEDDAKHLEQ